MTVGSPAIAADEQQPGSSFAEEETPRYLVPALHLWVGGDLTLTTTVPENGHASLELDDVNLLVRMEPSPRLAFFSETRLEDTLEVTERHGAVLSSSDIFIERLYADFLADPHVTIRVGKFLTPFGIWNQIRRAPLTWTVERPLVTERTFPEHTTGIGVFYQATLHGWSLDATVYGPVQDALPLRSSDEANMPLVGGRFAAAHEIGPAYVSFGLNAAGAERRDHGGLQPAVGADVNVNVGGNDLLGEFSWARSPERGADDEWGVYLQDAVPLLGNLYGVVRYEHFESFDHGAIDAGLVGLAWRLKTHLILKADYQFANKTTEDLPRGLLASFALFF